MDHEPQGMVVQRQYDALGRVTQETKTYPSGAKTVKAVTQTVYDDRAGTMTVTDPLGHVSVTHLDSLGHAMRMTIAPSGLALTRRFHYNGHGKVSKTIDPNGHATTTVWDGLDRKIEVDSPPLQVDGGGVAPAVTRWTYDFANQVLSKTDPRGVKTVHTYDAFGRELARQIAGQRVRSWTYNDTAEPAVVETDGNGNTIQHDLDALGREVKATDQEGHATQMVYDADGRMVQTTDRLGRVVRTGYDALGRKTGTTWVGGASGTGTDLTESVVYNDAARTVTTTDRAGVTHTKAYDGAGRLVSVTIADGSNSLTTKKQVFDLLGQRVSVTDANGNTTAYTYDAAGRKTKATAPDGAETHYGYDAMAHVTSVTDCEGRVVETRTYDDGYRLTAKSDGVGDTTSYGYDLAGEKTSVTDPLGNAAHFTYDARGRLTKVVDALGRTTTYAYDGNDNKTGITESGGLTTEMSYSPTNRLVKKVVGGSRVTEYRYDAEGNRTGLTDPKGQVFSYAYDALGRETHADYPVGSSPPAGVLKAIDRTYDPETGRFLTNDPVAGDALNPPSLHKYLYAYSSPMTFIDAWGEYALNNIQERLDPNPNNIDDFMNITRLVREATGKNGAFSAYRAAYEAIRAGAGVAKTRDFKHDARMKMYNLYNKLFGSDQAQNDLGFVYTEGKPESLRALDFSQGILNGLVQGLTPDKEGLKNLNAFAKDLQELKPWDNIGERVKVGLTASGVAAITLLVPEAIVATGAPGLIVTGTAGTAGLVHEARKAYSEGWTQFSQDIESNAEKPWLEGNDTGAATQFGAAAAAMYMTVRPPTGGMFEGTVNRVKSALKNFGQMGEPSGLLGEIEGLGQDLSSSQDATRALMSVRERYPYVFRRVSSEQAQSGLFANGLEASDPYATITEEQHIRGERPSQWISTSPDLEVPIRQYANESNPIVKIDLRKVTSRIVDLTSPETRELILSDPRAMDLADRSFEILIEGRVPPEAITSITVPMERK